MLRSVVIPLALALSGCAAMLPAPVPMESLRYERDPGKPQRCLLVMLPGRGDHARDYASHGFIEALRKRPMSVDVVAADAVFGYYARRTLVERLRTDVIEPARAKGYEQVWLMGISMGGLGSLFYSKANPGFAGAVLLAPFLGEEEVIDEIAKAGGPATWKPGNVTEDDWGRELWRWLIAAVAKDDPKIVLGFGESDRLAKGHRLLASILPEGRVYRTEGIHDWPAWTKLWDAVLDRSELSKACGEASAAP